MLGYDRSSRRAHGFTLVEVMISVLILSIVFMATVALLQFHRIQSRKAQDQAIMLDFCQHYLETARNLEFTSIVAGAPINTLFDGTDGLPSITFPTDSLWHSLSTTNFLNFHPDLQWFANRSPEYKCTIASQSASGSLRSKTITLQIQWNAPIGLGPKQSLRFDSTVYPDFH